MRDYGPHNLYAAYTHCNIKTEMDSSSDEAV